MEENQTHPQRVVRARKPRSFRALAWFFLGLIIVAVVFLGGRMVYLKSKGETGDGFSFFKLPFVDPNALAGEAEGRVNVLLVGVGGASHPKGGNLADTIMLASVDTTNQDSDQGPAAGLLSIPRDLLVKLPAPLKGQEKINAVHSYGEQQKKETGGGMAVMKKVAAEITDQPIHYTVRIDFTGLEKLVDSVGGVTIMVSKDIYDPYFPAPNLIDYEPFSLKAGTHKLNGKTALKYARSRYTTSDFDRSSRQQQIIKAIKDQFISQGYNRRPEKIIEIISILNKSFQTDMKVAEVVRLYKLVKDIPSDKIVSVVLDNSTDGVLKTVSNGGYYLTPKTGDWSEVQTLAADLLTQARSTSSQVKIEIQDGSAEGQAGEKLSGELKKAGYQVLGVYTAVQKYRHSKIYDYTFGEKKTALEALKKRLAATTSFTGTQALLQSGQSKVDVLIMVGDDYQIAETAPKE